MRSYDSAYDSDSVASENQSLVSAALSKRRAALGTKIVENVALQSLLGPKHDDQEALGTRDLKS